MLAGTRKSPFCQDFIGARIMEIEVTTGVIRRAKLQSNRHHQQTQRPALNTKIMQQKIQDESSVYC